MRKVRCVSPHGGCHHGMRADNGLPAHPGYRGPVKLAPNEGGWVDCPALGGHIAVGSVTDAPEAPAFIADGFHFVDDATGKADVCAGADGGCWCGGAHHAPPPPEDADGEHVHPGTGEEMHGTEHPADGTMSPLVSSPGWPAASAVVPDETGGM